MFLFFLLFVCLFVCLFVLFFCLFVCLGFFIIERRKQRHIIRHLESFLQQILSFCNCLFDTSMPPYRCTTAHSLQPTPSSPLPVNLTLVHGRALNTQNEIPAWLLLPQNQSISGASGRAESAGPLHASLFSLCV